MADTSINARLQGGSVQNTGNPVFDATVNIAMNMNHLPSNKTFQELHQCLLELYQQEPKRANPPERKSIAQMQQEARDLESRVH
jgi:hypothetical protein